MDDSGAPTEATSRMFPCERCGADLVFELGAWELACPYCGFAKGIALEEDAEEFAFILRALQMTDEGS